MQTAEQNGWRVEFDDAEPHRLYINRPGQPGRVNLKVTDEGLIVDIWTEDYERVESSAAALFSDLEPAEEN